MKYLKQLETFLPYIAAIVVFMSIKIQLDTIVYLIISILFSFYFFPLRILVESTEKKWFQITTSILFANILIFISISLFNPELHIIRAFIGVSAVLCIVLLIYKHIFEKLNVRIFFLLLGFNILASSSILLS